MAQEPPPRRQTVLPAWSAPVVGAVVLSGLGSCVAVRLAEPITITWLGGWAFTGALIGVTVWLCDEPGPEGVVSRFLALLSPPMAFFPLVGLFVAMFALKYNPHPGYHRRMSLAGLWLALAVNAVAAGAIVFG